MLVDQENKILAGHGRVEAAKLLAMTEIPCLRIETMTAAEKRAYVIADNKLALNAGWDDEIAAEELKALSALDLEFDVTLTGFSMAEIDSLVDGLGPEEAANPADDDLPADAPSRCHPGDIWQLGPHRLICGDARNSDTAGALMGTEQAQIKEMRARAICRRRGSIMKSGMHAARGHARRVHETARRIEAYMGHPLVALLR